jgi:hypothetical protein
MYYCVIIIKFIEYISYDSYLYNLFIINDYSGLVYGLYHDSTYLLN